MGFLEILLSGNAIIFYMVVIILAFAIFAVDMVNNEIKERNLENLLYKRLEVDEYLKVVGEFSARSRSKAQITKYNTYKALGLYYKDEKDKALEWLKVVVSDVESSNDIHIKILYTSVIFKILFRIGYNENVEKIYQSKKFIIDEMLKMKEYTSQAHYLLGIYNYEKKEYKIAYEELIEARKTAFNKLDKTMISYQLAKTCLELDKMEEAEREAENVMNTKHSAKNNLFIYDDLDKIIKERRAKTNTISSVDKDLEEERQLEALEKMNKEVEEAIDNPSVTTKEAKGSETDVNVPKKEIDQDVLKLKEEEDLKNQLDQMTQNLHNEMLINNNLNK